MHGGLATVAVAVLLKAVGVALGPPQGLTVVAAAAVTLAVYVGPNTVGLAYAAASLTTGFGLVLADPTLYTLSHIPILYYLLVAKPRRRVGFGRATALMIAYAAAPLELLLLLPKGGPIIGLAVYAIKVSYALAALRAGVSVTVLSWLEPAIALAAARAATLALRLCEDRDPVIGKVIGLARHRGFERLLLEPPYCAPLSPPKPSGLLVLGPPGSGKTRLVKQLVTSLKGVKLAVIDTHGEYGDSVEVNASVMNEGVNALEVGWQKPSYVVDILVGYFKRVYRVGPRQESILREALAAAVEDALSSNPPILKPSTLIGYIIGSDDPSSQSLVVYVRDFISKFTGRRTVSELLSVKSFAIDFAGVADQDYMQTLTELVLATLYSRVRSEGEANRPRVIVVVEEAHNFLPRGRRQVETLKLMITEARKYGVAVVLVTQNPSRLDDTALANVPAKLVLGPLPPSELARIVPYGDQARALNALTRGFAVAVDTRLGAGYAVIRRA